MAHIKYDIVIMQSEDIKVFSPPSINLLKRDVKASLFALPGKEAAVADIKKEGGPDGER